MRRVQGKIKISVDSECKQTLHRSLVFIRTMEPAYWSFVNLTILTFALASSLTGVSSAVTLSSTPGNSPSVHRPEPTPVTVEVTFTPSPTSPPSSIVYCVPHPDSPGSAEGNNNHNNNNNGGRGRGGSSFEDKRTRGKPRSKFAHDDDDDDQDHDGTSYEREGKYWLVPPFLIGASSIVVAYVIIHCLYMHCSCSDDRRRVPQTVRRVQIATTGHHHHHHGAPPTIVLSDPEDMAGSGRGRSPSTAGMPRMVPLVSYDGGSYGQTQLVEAQPFLIYEPYDDLDPPRPSPGLLQQPGQQQRRKSALLQLPQAIGRKLSQARLSFSSVGTPYREPRASICFVPVGRTLSDPSGATNLTFAEGNQSHGVLFAAAATPVGEPSACVHSCCKVCGVSAAASSGVETTGAGGGGTDGGTAAAVTSSPPQPLPVIVVDELETAPSISFQASPSSPSPLTTDTVSNSYSCLGDVDPDSR